MPRGIRNGGTPQPSSFLDGNNPFEGDQTHHTMEQLIQTGPAEPLAPSDAFSPILGAVAALLVHQKGTIGNHNHSSVHGCFIAGVSWARRL